MTVTSSGPSTPATAPADGVTVNVDVIITGPPLYSSGGVQPSQTPGSGSGVIAATARDVFRAGALLAPDRPTAPTVTAATASTHANTNLRRILAPSSFCFRLWKKGWPTRHRALRQLLSCSSGT